MPRCRRFHPPQIDNALIAWVVFLCFLKDVVLFLLFSLFGISFVEFRRAELLKPVPPNSCLSAPATPQVMVPIWSGRPPAALSPPRTGFPYPQPVSTGAGANRVVFGFIAPVIRNAINHARLKEAATPAEHHFLNCLASLGVPYRFQQGLYRPCHRIVDSTFRTITSSSRSTGRAMTRYGRYSGSQTFARTVDSRLFCSILPAISSAAA